ncbi:hypothetical protein [Microbacterium hibisci]|uniref:hypothetical protein n=1 Tax=Microbacterium hibisci TaxID=2036000 RepID=UPI00194181C9|nr:hypothetical protein [Microbacterium hibisci]
MGIDDIWMQLTGETRDWLIANNGDAVPADIASEIDDVADAANADDVWAADSESVADAAGELDDDEDADDEPGARYLAEDAVEWIEEYANDE